MKKVLLVSISDIINGSVIESNIDQKLLAKTLEIVQENYFKAILGDDLYTGLIDAVYNYSVSGSPISTAYSNLITASKPYLQAKTVADFLLINNYKVTNKGLMKLNDNSATALSESDLQAVKDYYDNLVSTYKASLIKFLKDTNLIDYSNDVQTTSEGSGWFLGKDYSTIEPVIEAEPNISNYVSPENGTYTYQELDILGSVLLISPSDVILNSIVEDNVSQDLLSLTIKTVQEVYLKPILTDALYFDVLNAVYQFKVNSILFSNFYTDIMTLIEPYIINKAVAEFIIPNNYKFSSKGLMKLNDNSATALSESDLQSVKDYYDNLSTTYKINLLDFLKKYNIVTGGNDDNITSDATGWFLGSGRLVSNVTSSVYPTTNSGSIDLRNDKYTTGATLNGSILVFNRSDLSSAYSIDLSSLRVTAISAVTLANNVLSVTPNNGSTSTYTINAVTGGSYSNGVLTLSGSGLGYITITGFTTGSTSSSATTIYNGDGSLTGNRLVNLGSNTLRFSSSTQNYTLVLSGDSVGIGSTGETGYRLTVSGQAIFTATTNPLTLKGLQSASDSTILTIDASGVVHTIPVSSISGSSSGSGSTSVGGVRGNGQANYISKWSGTTGITISTIFDNGSNIGINTSTPFNGATNALNSVELSGATANLTISDYATLGKLQSNGYGAVGSNFYLDSSSLALRRKVADVFAAIDFSAGGFLFKTAGSSTANSVITTNTIMQVLANGRVQIGTTTDSGYKLDVAGTARISGTSGTTLYIGDGTQKYNGLSPLIINNGSYNLRLGFESNGFYGVVYADSGLVLSGQSGGSIRFIPSSFITEYDTNNFKSTNAALTFNAGHRGAFAFETYATTTRYSAITAVYTDNNNWGVRFNTMSAGATSEALRIVNSNVLIGKTVDSGYRFDVNGASRLSGNTLIIGDAIVSGSTLNRTTKLNNTGLYFSRLSDGSYVSSIYADGSLTFDTRNNFNFIANGGVIGRFYETGNLMVNQSSDTGYRFDVGGTTRLSGVTNPLTLIGLQAATDSNLLTIDGSGVVHTIAASAITGTSSVEVFVTGGTYTAGTITFRNTTGGTFTVTGFSTGTTFTDTFVTGGTYANGTTTFRNSTGGTFSISGYSTGTTSIDTVVTGGTYANGTATFRNNTGGTFSVTGFTTGSTSSSAPTLATKSGLVSNSSFTGTPKKASVTFATPFTGTSYSIVVTGEDARIWTTETKLTTGFVINSNSDTALAGTTSWIAMMNGEVEASSGSTSGSSSGSTSGSTSGGTSGSTFAPEVVVGAGEYQQFFIDPAGQLWAQGNSNPAFLGTNLVNTQGQISQCVQASGQLPRMVKCYGGIHDGKAIDEFGYVWHMGENGLGIADSGFAGDGTTAWSNYTVRIDVDASGNTFNNVKSVQIFGSTDAAGYVALKNDGTVWVWGLCIGGHRGNGTSGGTELSPQQVYIPGNKFVTQVSAGISIMALCSDGTIYSWGNITGGAYDVYQSALGYNATGTTYYSPHIVDNVTGATGVVNHGRISFAWSPTKIWYCGHAKYAGINDAASGPVSPFTDITSSISTTGGTIAFPIKQMVVNQDCVTHLIDANNALWGTGNSGRGALGTGLVANLSTTSPKAWNFFDSYSGAESTYYSYKWVRVLPERSDFKNIYAIVPWGFNKYFETYDGQLYACGRNKSGVIANGVYSNDSSEPNHPDGYNISVATPVNPYITSGISAQSPWCLANPADSACSGHPAPSNLPPTVSGSNQTITGTSIVISGTAIPQSGRTISTYVWQLTSKPVGSSYPYMYGLNTPALTVTGMTTTGAYAFKMIATDNKNSTSATTITITKS